MVAYTDNQGAWESAGLTRDGTSSIWQGTIPVTGDLIFFVQAVDKAGNVAMDETTVAHTMGHVL